ncbi:MAG TPA: hypothetical protein V6C89_15620 [Drouetiella sp.]
MNTNRNLKDSKQVAKSAIASAIILTAMVGQMVFIPQAFAQGVSPDQDSLLPPEVVPLDAAGGSNFASNGTLGQSPLQTPGSFASSQQSAPAFNPADMQSAQQWRKAAFDSLTNNPNAQPVYAPQQNPQLMSMQGQMGQMPGQQPGQPGQPWMNSSGQPMMGAAQTQTLSGAVAQQPAQVQKGTGKTANKLSGISHAVGMASLFGGGMLMGSLMSGRMYVNPMSTSLMGIGMANYAMRGLQF